MNASLPVIASFLAYLGLVLGIGALPLPDYFESRFRDRGRAQRVACASVIVLVTLAASQRQDAVLQEFDRVAQQGREG